MNITILALLFFVLLKTFIISNGSIEAVFILVNDEEVDDIDHCVGEEDGEEGEEGGEEGENGGEEGEEQIPTGEVECSKIYKVIADRPGQLQGYIEFISPANADNFDIEVKILNLIQISENYTKPKVFKDSRVTRGKKGKL